MTTHTHLVFLATCSALLLLAATQTSAVTYYQVINNAANTPGGARFNTQIGSSSALQTLSSATTFIWRILQQPHPSTRKNVQQVTLYVDNMSGVAYTSGNQIHLSASYVAGYSGDVIREVTGVLYHEMAHVWQWSGNGQAPGGLIEGVADFVRLKAGYDPAHWVKPGQGNRWDQGYDVTARFLDYCDSLKSGFVAQLNAKMRNGYTVGFFNDLLGKSVDQLWADYKAKYSS